MFGPVELRLSVSGAPVRLIVGSINQRDAQFREFTYHLGHDSVQAMAKLHRLRLDELPTATGQPNSITGNRTHACPGLRHGSERACTITNRKC